MPKVSGSEGMTQLENFGGEKVSMPIDSVSDSCHHREVHSHTEDGDSHSGLWQSSHRNRVCLVKFLVFVLVVFYGSA